MLALPLLAAALPARAEAADTTVNNCNEGSLQAAIDNAPSGGTVDFACDGIIRLFSQQQITINKPLSLDAAGHNVTVTGQGQTGLFFLTGGGEVTMRGFTLTAGWMGDTGQPGGGAVEAINATFHADRMRFIGNFSVNQGGAISASGNVGGVIVTDSEFVGNSADCNVASCVAGGGGAIAVAGGVASRIERSTFRDNSATGRGGGGAVLAKFTFNPDAAGALTISDSVFEQNQAGPDLQDSNRPGYGGGAVMVQNHPLTIERSRFDGNVSDNATAADLTYAGAVAIGGIAAPSLPLQPATITDSEFTNSRSLGLGLGGAVSVQASPTEIDSSSLIGNDAGNRGGGVYAAGPVALTDSIVRDNSAGIDGGGIYAADTVDVLGTDVIGNDPQGCFVEAGFGAVVDAGANFEAPTASCGFAPIARPTLAIGDATVQDPEPGAFSRTALPLTLSSPLSYPLRVAYATENGTAVAGQDYEAASGELTIPAGQTTAQVPVEVRGSATVEPDETFAVQLSLPEPGRAQLAGTGRGTVTILADPDPAPPTGKIEVTQRKLRGTIAAVARCDRACDAVVHLFRGRRQLGVKAVSIPAPGGAVEVSFELRERDLRRLKDELERKGAVNLRLGAQFSGPGGKTSADLKFRLR